MHKYKNHGIHFTMLWERGVNMELKVFRDTISAAGRSFTVKSEIPIETEILISDYLPQVFKIVKCITKMVVLQKKLQPGRLLLEGYLRCVVYYQGEDSGGLCQTEQKIPFSKALEIPAEEYSDWSATVGGEVEYLNCRAVHQRRVEIRGAWELSAAVFTQYRKEVVCAVSEAGTAQKQSPVKGMRNISSVDKLITAESDFSFELAPEAVLDISGSVQIREQKVMRGKFVVKGEIMAQLAYRTNGDDKLLSQRVMIPFVQILDIDDLAEDCQCFCVLEPAGFTLQAAPDSGDKHRISASAMLHLRAFRDYSIDVVEECFSTQYELNTSTEPITTELLETTLNEHQTVTAQIPLPQQSVQILSCFAVPAAPEILVRDGQCGLRIRAQLSVLYKNDLDELESQDSAAEIVLPLEHITDAESVHPEIWISVDSMNCILSAEHAEVSASLHVEGFLLRCNTQPVLLDVELGEELEPDDSEIVLRACYVQAGEQVFDVARRFHVLPTKIMQANGLTEESIPTGTCLLIPCTE